VCSGNRIVVRVNLTIEDFDKYFCDGVEVELPIVDKAKSGAGQGHLRLQVQRATLSEAEYWKEGRKIYYTAWSKCRTPVPEIIPVSIHTPSMGL
jgi:hypothetical protein